MGILIFFVAVVIIAAAVLVAYQREQRVDEAWGDAARQLGMDYEQKSGGFFSFGTKPGRLITGTTHGVTMQVDVIRKGSGNNQSSYTRYRAGYPSLGLGLSVTQTGLFRRIMKAFGAQDIEIGDAEFDDAFIIKGTDPGRVAAFFDPSKTMAVHRLLTDYSDATVGDAQIMLEQRGVQRKPDVLTSLVRRLVSVASLFTGAGRSGVAMNEALDRQRRGDLAHAAELLRKAATTAKDDVELRRLEGEALYSSGRYNEATEVFARLENDLPADPWATQWRQRAQSRSRLPPPPSPPKALPPAFEAPDTILSAGVVADEIFDPTKLSFESTEAFEDRFEGKRVRWSGVLQRSSSYTTDLDFGRGPGVKAVFEVHRLTVDLFGGRDVDAVVQLPADAEDVLRNGRDEIFTFEGTLVKVDALMRNLFLENGRLV